MRDDYDFDIELDFDLMGIEEYEELHNDEVPEEIKGWVEDKPMPNLGQTTTINIGTFEEPKELQIGSDLTTNQKDEMAKLLI